jgi:hypothetical protein
MAVKPPAPRPTISKRIFSLSLAERLRSIPFGGALGVAAAGGALWLAPEILPAGWSSQSFLALGMGVGIVADRVVSATIGWVIAPVLRHLAARWEAMLQLRKLGGYQKRRVIGEADGKRIALRIAKSDVAGVPPPKP